ncbi:MAG: hypothetical protein LUQ16_03120 [Methanomassiliicoccales archaeon]|nr:hypothetical protein [Methanomassiliicoccales archaeon]
MPKLSGIVALGLIGLVVMSALAVGAYAASAQSETALQDGSCSGDCDRTMQKDRDGSCGQCVDDCDGTPDQVQQRDRDRSCDRA